MAIMIRRTFSSLNKSFSKDNYNLDEAREFFKKFSGGSVLLEKDDSTGVGKIIIDNIKKKNSFTGKMFVDFETCVNQLKEWNEGKIVIVQGNGNDFCTGGDLNFIKQIATPELGYWMNSYFGGTLKNLNELPIISVANIKGYCLGGGTEIVSNCDLRFMQSQGKIGVVQGRMGVIQTWNGASKLMDIVGKGNAIKLLAMSSVLSSKKALEINFIDELYNTDEEFYKLIKKLTKNNIEVLRTGKDMFTKLSKEKGTTSSKLHEIELKYSTKVWGEKNHVEALNNQIKHK